MKHKTGSSGNGGRKARGLTLAGLLALALFIAGAFELRADESEGSPQGSRPEVDATDTLPVVPLEERGAAAETSSVEIERPSQLRFEGALDDRPSTRKLPPLDEIEPMPLPDGSDGYFSGFPESGHPVVYDPATGETRELVDFRATFDEEEGSSGGGYRGTDGGLGEDGEIYSVFGTLSQVTAVGSFPWRMNCKLVMRYIDGSGNDRFSQCSGVMVDAETVLTAGHCIFDQTWGWAVDVWVLPGWDGVGSLPPDTTMNTYGFAEGESWVSWSTWTQGGDFDGDVGVVRVNRAVGMLTGSFGWAHSGDCASAMSRTYFNASYPAQACEIMGLHNGRDMYTWNGSIDSCPDNQFRVVTTGGCFDAAWGGMSGSGLYYIENGSRYVHGVLSTSDRATYVRYCKHWESWIDYVWDTFIPASRGDSFDVQPLNVTCEPSTILQGDSTTLLRHQAINATNATDSGTYTVRVYLSTNDFLSVGDTLLSTQTLNWNFTEMDSVNVNMVNVTIPANTPPGDYWLGVIYDLGTDGDSTNNATHYWDAAPISVDCPGVSAPVSVSATDGTYCDRVEITWSPVLMASEYRVYRDGFALAGWQTATSYEDFTAQPGQDYTYQVRARNVCDDWSSPSLANSGSLCTIPANDDCDDADEVFVGSKVFTTEHSSTDGPSESGCAECCGSSSIEFDVWFSYFASENGRVSLSLCGTPFDSMMAVYEGGCPGSGSLVGCNDDASCGDAAELEFFCEAGQTYRIRVGSATGETGPGVLWIDFEASEVDDCLGVDTISVLKINNNTGDPATRIVRRPHDSIIQFQIDKPAAGGNGKFVVHLNPGMPTSDSISPLPAGLGETCFPFLISAGAQPTSVWTNINKPAQIGVSNHFGVPVPDPQRAPTMFYSAVNTQFPIFSAWTLQGAIINPQASSPKGVSVTNPVLLEVTP